jgi:hypothetical protein
VLSKQDVIDGVTKLVADKYAGDWKAAWTAFAGDSGRLDRSDVENVLDAAAVGSRLTRWAIAGAVLNEIGSNGTITWEQFQTLIPSGA